MGKSSNCRMHKRSGLGSADGKGIAEHEYTVNPVLDKVFYSISRGGSKTPATCKMECFVKILNY